MDSNASKSLAHTTTGRSTHRPFEPKRLAKKIGLFNFIPRYSIIIRLLFWYLVIIQYGYNLQRQAPGSASAPMSLPKSQSELDSSVPACITDKTVWLYLEVDNDLYTINQAGFVFGLTIKGTVRRKRFGEHPGPLCRKRRPGCRDVNA